jgi:hypothetical protein
MPNQNVAHQPEICVKQNSAEERRSDFFGGGGGCNNNLVWQRFKTLLTEIRRQLLSIFFCWKIRRNHIGKVMMNEECQNA